MLPLPRTRAALAAAALVLSVAGPTSAAPPPRIEGRCPEEGEPIPDDDLLCCAEDPVPDDEQVSVDTPLGTLVIELYSNVAPETVANFLGYIERGDYTDTFFHRIVADFVIQTGGFTSSGVFFEAVEKLDPVDNEPCLSNVAGTVAMAKVGSDPDSATSEWFVSLVDNSGNLDVQNAGFTVFGSVLFDGLDVANAIADAAPETPPAQPIPPYFVAVQDPLWTIFQDAPLQTPLVLDPPSYGCFDLGDSGVLLVENPLGAGDWEPNVAHDLSYTIVSPACEGTGAGGTGPSIACSDPGRRVILLDPDTGLPVPDIRAPFGFAEVTLSCDGIAASEVSFANRLNDVAAQLDTSLVKATYTVPEPSRSLAAAASLLTLTGLARLRRRRAG